MALESYDGSGHGKELGEWFALFKESEVSCNVAGLFLPRKQDRSSHLLVLPPKANVNRAAEIFSETLRKFDVAASVGPVTLDDECIYTLSDMVVGDYRDTFLGGYARWVPRDFKGTRKLTRKPGMDIEPGMSLIEALWYSLYMIKKYGKSYLDLNYDYSQKCGGTRGGIPGGSRKLTPWLEWDIGDASVWLQWN